MPTVCASSALHVAGILSLYPCTIPRASFPILFSHDDGSESDDGSGSSDENLDHCPWGTLCAATGAHPAQYPGDFGSDHLPYGVVPVAAIHFAHTTLDGPDDLSATARIVIDELQIAPWDPDASSSDILRSGLNGHWRGFVTSTDAQLQCLECVIASCGIKRDRRLSLLGRSYPNPSLGGHCEPAVSTPTTSDDELAIVD